MKVQNFRLGKKMIAATVMGSILVTMISGCGTAKKETKDTPITTSSAPTKLVIATPSEPNIQDYETNGLTKLIEEKMNVDLEFLMLPNKVEDAKTKVSLMVSSGEKLPDVIKGVIDDISAYDYAMKGILIKLDDYYKKPTAAPSYTKMSTEDRNYIYNNLKLADGSVYSIPYINKTFWNEGPYRFFMNTTWMKKLDLKAPTTTDELYNVLKAFVEKDPNGNGKKDEIGMVGSNNGWGQNPMVYLMNSFIYANPDKGYFDVKSGKITASFVQPEWKQGLEYMNKLVKDGLLSPLSFTQDQTQLKSLINVKDGMAGAIPSGSYSVFIPKQLGFEGTYAGYDIAAPVKGPKGVAYSPHNPTLPLNMWYITKDSKNPEVAFKVGDYLLSPEISFMNRYGEKGVDWSDDAAAIDQYLFDADFSVGKRKVAVLNKTFWGNPQNKTWLASTPSFADGNKILHSSTKKTDDISKETPDYNPFYNKNYAPLFPKEVITRLNYAPEELKKISNSKTAIDNYVKETSIRFIAGNKPFSEWDSYIAELKKMGLEEYMTATQAAFDKSK